MPAIMFAARIAMLEVMFIVGRQIPLAMYSAGRERLTRKDTLRRALLATMYAARRNCQQQRLSPEKQFQQPYTTGRAMRPPVATFSGNDLQVNDIPIMLDPNVNKVTNLF